MATVTKANLATYLAGLTPSVVPYSVEITETIASDWGSSGTIGTVGNIIRTSTPSGVYLDLGLTVIPSSVTNMNSTFRDCTSLTTAPSIPSSVTNITYTFYYCTSLTTAPSIPSSVTNMYFTFRSCTSLTTAPSIPSSVTNMYSTFRSCTSLTTAPSIPSSVINMEGTFYGCTSLTTIESFSVDVDTCIMTDAFYNCPALTAIYVAEVAETTWHLIHTDTDATGTDFTIYKPDGTVAGSGTVAGTSQVMSLYGKSDELVISNNITSALAIESATTQLQWHKSGLPYDDELFIFNAKNPTTVISNVLTTTLRRNASFTIPEYPDGKKIRIANTHASNTITCTLPTGQTMNGQSSFTIAPDTILEFELIGTAWKCVSKEWEKIHTYTSNEGGGNISQYKTLRLNFFTSQQEVQNSVIVNINDLQSVSGQRRLVFSCYYQTAAYSYQCGGYITIDDSGNVNAHSLYKNISLSWYKTELYGMK